jgi:hypothetical protein
MGENQLVFLGHQNKKIPEKIADSVFNIEGKILDLENQSKVLKSNYHPSFRGYHLRHEYCTDYYGNEVINHRIFYFNKDLTKITHIE